MVPETERLRTTHWRRDSVWLSAASVATVVRDRPTKKRDGEAAWADRGGGHDTAPTERSPLYSIDDEEATPNKRIVFGAAAVLSRHRPPFAGAVQRNLRGPLSTPRGRADLPPNEHAGRRAGPGAEKLLSVKQGVGHGRRPVAGRALRLRSPRHSGGEVRCASVLDACAVS